MAALVSVHLAAVAQASAQAAFSGYCDAVGGAADADAARLAMPAVFGSIGYIDQPVITVAPEATSDDLRLTAGVAYSLGNLYQAGLTRDRARADCRRFHALQDVRDARLQRALRARLEVLDSSLTEAGEMLARAADDLSARRATVQEVTATRMRIRALRELAATTRAELSTLPASSASSSGALAALYRADADVESYDGRLRRARSWDVSVRAGYDAFLTSDADDSPFFAVAIASFNLGWLLQGSANERAAAGRRRLLRDEPNPEARESLQSLFVDQQQRLTETGALLEELETQLEQLTRIGGESSRRLRRTVWFEWVEVKAEHAYLEAHVASLREILEEGR